MNHPKYFATGYLVPSSAHLVYPNLTPSLHACPLLFISRPTPLRHHCCCLPSTSLTLHTYTPADSLRHICLNTQPLGLGPFATPLLPPPTTRNLLIVGKSWNLGGIRRRKTNLSYCFMGWLDAGPFLSPWISIFFSSPERGAPSHRPARRAQCPTHLTQQEPHEDTPRHHRRTHSPPRKEPHPLMLLDPPVATQQHLNTMPPCQATHHRHQHPLPRDLHQC